MKIAVAGTGYVGLSIATLLAQHNTVTAVDIIPEKVELINNRKSPIHIEISWKANTTSASSGVNTTGTKRNVSCGRILSVPSARIP